MMNTVTINPPARRFLTIPAMLAAAFMVAVAPAAPAQTVNTSDLSKSANKKQKVDIESDSMEIIDDQNKAVFTGKVVAKRGDVTLYTDKLVADFVKTKQKDDTEKTEVTFLTATGHVVIITPKQHITGNWAKMNVKADTAVVGGNVVVRQDKTVIRGKKLNVNLKTNRSVMTGGRVKGSFVPK